MVLFRKKKEKQKDYCEYGNISQKIPHAEKMIFSVKVLGSGCEKCNALEKAVCGALIELNVDIAIEHVTDFAQIAAYGVMTTPALVVNDHVISYGKVLKKEEVKILLQKFANR